MENKIYSLNTGRKLEEFAGKAVYRLANTILDEYSAKGFDFQCDEDMRRARIVNCASQLLHQLGEHEKGAELRIKANSLIIFPPEFRVVRA